MTDTTTDDLMREITRLDATVTGLVTSNSNLAYLVGEAQGMCEALKLRIEELEHHRTTIGGALYDEVLDVVVSAIRAAKEAKEETSDGR